MGNWGEIAFITPTKMELFHPTSGPHFCSRWRAALIKSFMNATVAAWGEGKIQVTTVIYDDTNHSGGEFSNFSGRVFGGVGSWGVQIPNTQSMVYLPTFTIDSIQM